MVQYLHFRILKFPLIINYPFWGIPILRNPHLTSRSTLEPTWCGSGWRLASEWTGRMGRNLWLSYGKSTFNGLVWGKIYRKPWLQWFLPSNMVGFYNLFIFFPSSNSVFHIHLLAKIRVPHFGYRIDSWPLFHPETCLDKGVNMVYHLSSFTFTYKCFLKKPLFFHQPMGIWDIYFHHNIKTGG